MNITTSEYLADHYFNKTQLKKVIKKSKELNITTKNEELVLRYLMYQDFKRMILLWGIESIKEKENGLIYYRFRTNKATTDYCTSSEAIEKGRYSIL